MGKRQMRIFKPAIPERLGTLLGREANVILHNNTTLHGIIMQTNEQTLLVRDMRMKKHLVPVNSISEIILDQETSF